MFKKVGTKIIITIVFCCVFMTLLQGLIMAMRFNKFSNSDMQNLVSSIAESNNNLIEQRMQKVMDVTDNIIAMVNGIVDPKLLPSKAQEYENIIDPIIKKILEDNINYVMGAYLILNPEQTDRVYGAYYEDVEVTGNLQKMKKYDKSRFDKSKNTPSWYYECINLKEGKWFEPYVSSAGIEMTSFTKPIYKDDTYIGMLSIDINFKLFKEYVNSIQLINSGYIFVLNEKYDFIMHNTYTYEDNLGTINDGKYKDIINTIETNASSVLNIDVNGEAKFLSYRKLSNGWILCALLGKDSLIQRDRELINIVAVIMVLAIVLSSIIAIIIGGRISSSITYVTNSLNTLSKLDLTIGEKNKLYEQKHSKNDQLGNMISSTSNLRNHLRTIIPQIQDNSKTTLDNSNDLNKSIKQSSESMNGITEVMNQLSSGSQEQTENAKNGVDKLSILAEMIEDSINCANDVKSHLSNTQEANKTNIDYMNNLSDKFNSNIESSKQISDNIKVLSEKTRNIQTVVTTIESIAKRTTLLSLNASIEASAAGDAGKGFAVVAKEIGKLAQQTKDGTKQIQDIVDEISENMVITEDSMKTGNLSLEEALVAMDNSKQSFDIIDKDINSMADVSNNLIDLIEQINQNKEDVILAMNSILSVSEETASSVDGIIDTVNQETLNINNLAQATKNLRNISNILDSIVNSFKI